MALRATGGTMRRQGLAMAGLLMSMAAATACGRGAGGGDGADGAVAVPTTDVSDAAITSLSAISAPTTSAASPVPVVTWPSDLLDCRAGPVSGMVADYTVATDPDPMPVDSPLEPATAALAGMSQVIAEGDPAVVLEVIEQTTGRARVLGRSGERAVVTMLLSVRGGRWTVDTSDACYAGQVGTQVPPPIPLTETLRVDARSTLEPPAGGAVPPVDVPALLAVARPAFDRSTFVQALLYGTYVRVADGDEPARSVPAIDFTASEACASAGPVPAPTTTRPMMCTHHVIVELEAMTVLANVVMGPATDG
jgi:hypothetical protein